MSHSRAHCPGICWRKSLICSGTFFAEATAATAEDADQCELWLLGRQGRSGTLQEIEAAVEGGAAGAACEESEACGPPAA